jgi:hypothetical protein
MAQEMRVRLSAYIPYSLFDDLEDERHRRSKAVGKRISVQCILQEALEMLLRPEVRP